MGAPAVIIIIFIIALPITRTHTYTFDVYYILVLVECCFVGRILLKESRLVALTMHATCTQTAFVNVND